MILDRIHNPKQRDDSFPFLAMAVPAVCALLAIGIWQLSLPSHVTGRIASLETAAATVTSASSARGDLKAFPVGSVCVGESIDVIKSQLSTALTGTSMQVGNFDISDIGPANVGGLEAYRMTFKGTGSYEDALALLDTLNRHRPKLFLDSVALRNQVNAVDLDVTGRLFCR